MVPWLIGGLFVAIFGVLRAVLPARTHRNTGDSLLGQDRHPALFQTIESIARAAGEPMPAAVSLTSSRGAALSEEGGFLALGSRRVLHIGYPTLLMLTIDEFRALLAHEFGHYAACDTKFIRWIYPARAAIEHSLRSARGPWRMIFEWYGRTFLRVTQGLCRRQEYNADKFAASVTSPAITVSALRAHGSNLFSSFVANELRPVLQQGMLPPIAQGFETYRKEYWQEEKIEEPPASPYESHPAFAARVKALHGLPQTVEANPHQDRALTLLNYPDQLELWFAKQIHESTPGLYPIEWKNCRSIFVCSFEEETAKFKDLFQYIRFKEIPLILPEQVSAAVQCVYSIPNPRAYAEFLVGRAAGLALLHQGWKGKGAPGDPIWFTNGEQRLNPSRMVKHLWSGKMTGREWRAMADRAGIADLPLLATEAAPANVY